MFNDLIKELVDNGFDTFAFADDLAVNAFLDKRLKKAIKIIEKWTEENKMTINRKKSGIIYHTKKNRKSKDSENRTYMGFPVRTEYKYLGIMIDKNLSFQKHLE